MVNEQNEELLEQYLSLKKSFTKLHKLAISVADYDLNNAEILMIMKLEPDRELTLSKLSEVTGFSNTMVTFTVDSLEEKGLIRRIRGNDRRIYYAKLTEKGKEKYLELREKMRNKISDAFDKLKPEEKEQFSRCVETISALLDKIT